MSDKEVITVKEYFNAVLSERDKRTEQRFELMAEAVRKAEVAHEKRLEGMNEFRNQLSDQAETFLTKNEYNLAHNNLEEKYNNLKEKVSELVNTKQGSGQAWTYIVMGVLAFVAVCSLIINIINLR
jgi:hypothetical protein